MSRTTPRRLLLLRHAKAASPDGVADHERPLTARGRRNASSVGEWLASQMLVPDLVLCSDAVRTRETTDLVLSGLAADDGRVPVRALPDLYYTTVHRVLDLVSETAEDVATLLVVGHEPTTSAVVAAVTGRDVSIPTAAVAVVELDGDWAEVAAGAGRLVTVHVPQT
jgi:phosphohistidine phosphatase